MSAVLETKELGKRYGSVWALRDCTLEIPTGSVSALVGPNGAGKTTLLHLAVGLSEPSAGVVRVLCESPQRNPAGVLPRVGFVAQEHPLYRGFTVAETLALGRQLNPSWDGDAARARIGALGLPFLLAGALRSVYDLGLYLVFREVPLAAPRPN